MNQKQAKKAGKLIAEEKAANLYAEFNELIQQAYAVQIHGYMWENKIILDRTNPDYTDEREPDIDNPIISDSLIRGINIICDAAMATHLHPSEQRIKYFKAAIAYCIQVDAYKHVFDMAVCACHHAKDKNFFLPIIKRYKNIKETKHLVVLDLDTCLTILNKIGA